MQLLFFVLYCLVSVTHSSGIRVMTLTIFMVIMDRVRSKHQRIKEAFSQIKILQQKQYSIDIQFGSNDCTRRISMNALEHLFSSLKKVSFDA